MYEIIIQKTFCNEEYGFVYLFHGKIIKWNEVTDERYVIFGLTLL